VAEAAHVVWIFEQVADGKSPRAIAHDLNQRGIASARGGTWAVSAIAGSTARGLGLLNNELYRGRVVWNRRQWLKDPETGARRYVERPQAEWQQREAPELRIISEALWQRVHAGAASGPTRGARTGKGAVPKTLFGGLLVCKGCGGPVIAINRERYGCGVHKDRGDAVCAAGATFLRETVDRRLLSELRAGLLEPAAIAELQGAVRSLLAAQARADGGAEAPGSARRRCAPRSPASSTRSPASASAPPWRAGCAPPRPSSRRSRRRPPSAPRRGA
jgi:site-specific DNA recombinase